MPESGADTRMSVAVAYSVGRLGIWVNFSECPEFQKWRMPSRAVSLAVF